MVAEWTSETGRQLGMRRERVLSDPAVVTLASGRAERVNRRQTAENEREVPTDEHDDDQPFGQPLTRKFKLALSSVRQRVEIKTMLLMPRMLQLLS